uniref:Ribosomal protein L20 n=1 Tax=Romanomermis culicivorax TaxID=13658 RepID=A0A915HSF5_ROMCU
MFVICQKRSASSYRKTRKIVSRILKGAWLIERGVAAVAEENIIQIVVGCQRSGLLGETEQL